MPVDRIEAFKDEFAALFEEIAAIDPEVTTAARPCSGILQRASPPNIDIEGFGSLPLDMSPAAFQYLGARFRCVDASRPNDIYIHNHRDFTITSPDWPLSEMQVLNLCSPDIYWPPGEYLECSGLLISGPGSDISWHQPNPQFEINALVVICLPSRYRGSTTFETAYGRETIRSDSLNTIHTFIGSHLDIPQSSTPIASGYRLALVYLVPYAEEDPPELDPIRDVKKLCQRWKRRTTYRPDYIIYPLARQVDPLPPQLLQDSLRKQLHDERIIQAVCAAAVPLGFDVYQADLVYLERGIIDQRTYGMHWYRRAAATSVPISLWRDVQESLRLWNARRMDENGEICAWERLDDDLIHDDAMVGESIEDIISQASPVPPMWAGSGYVGERSSKRYVLVIFPPEPPQPRNLAYQALPMY